MSTYCWVENNLQLALKIQPGAARDEICGIYGDRIKIRIRSVAEQGRANKHLVNYLSKCFGVKKSDVTIISGTAQALKQVIIQNPVHIPETLSTLIKPSG